MNEQQKITVGYCRDPSMDLPEEDAVAEFVQYVEDLRKVDPSIPPMPEGDTSDPLSPASRWWCEHFRLPLLAEDFNGGDKHAFWNALTQIAEHQLPPPAWLAAAMLTEFSEKATPKNIQDDKRHTIGMTPEAVLQMYDAMKANRTEMLAEGMAEAARLRERGLHRKAETIEQQTRDNFKTTMEVIAKDDMNISLAQLKRLLKFAKDREEQRATIADRLP